MLTKYILHYDDIRYELKEDDLYNWDQISCSYKRGNYDGVVRSFSSQFVCVNQAREILLNLYMRDRYDARASISVHTITDRLEWEQKFICPLDFSTISWDEYTLEIKAVDNSLAALIKANKSTKYEFAVGSDILPDETFLFNRLTIKEGLTYEITEGMSQQQDGSLIIETSENDRIFCGVVNSDEIYIGGVIEWRDDQTKEPGSYMIKALRPVDITLDFRCETDQCYEEGTGLSVGFYIIHQDGTTQVITLDGGSTFAIGSTGKIFCGTYNSENTLREAWPYSTIYVDGVPKTNYWAIVNGSVWSVVHGGYEGTTHWENQIVSPDSYRRMARYGKGTVSLDIGDKIAMLASGNGAHVFNSNINFRWSAKGSPCHIPAFTPQTLAESLLSNIADDKISPLVFISDHDSRVSNTLILAAESIRGIPDAKLYSSFNDFCDWMSAVFGYVYYIGEERESDFRIHSEALGGYTSTPYPINNNPWNIYNSFEPAPEDIFYFEYYGKFVAYNGSEWFGNFPGDEDYNDPLTNHPRSDVLYSIKRFINGEQKTDLYYFKSDAEGVFENEPSRYRGKTSDIFNVNQEIHFVHRSEILKPDSAIRSLGKSRGVRYGVDVSLIYSCITIGYDKKDYENVNGRDEFNFSNTYSTGCSITDKTLSLISKYRADCYGIEFAAQKRGANTTDSSIDNDVFFVLCTTGTEGLKIPDTSVSIANCISRDVFNGAFSPMACIRANAGFIGLQADEMTLKFASSTGNSDIAIDGESISADISLDTPLATSGFIEFSTDEIDDIVNLDELVEVTDDEGTIYRGFLKEADVKYTKPEAVKYKLIIKEIDR